MYVIPVIVQIMLESLPISSSGHAQLLGLHMPAYLDRLALGPTLIMLVVYFYKEIVELILNLKNQWRWISCWGLLIIMATSVTVFLYDLIDQLLKGMAAEFPLWIGFALTTIMLFSLRWCTSIQEHRNDARSYYVKLLIIGIAQGCARLPGVSRLGATYTVACWLGFTPYRAFRISCALQIPLFAAGFLEGCVKLLTLWRMGTLELSLSLLTLLIIAGATVVAYLLLWGIEALMEHRKIWYVGWYMLAVTVASFFLNYLEFFEHTLVR